jgi:hypothetical protein
MDVPSVPFVFIRLPLDFACFYFSIRQHV